MELIIKGSRVRDILDQSEFSASLKDGQWTLQDRNTKAKLNVRIVEGKIAATPGEPIILTLDSRIKEEPFKITIQTGRLVTLAKPKSKTFTSRSGVILTFSGFKSRCMTPFS